MEIAGRAAAQIHRLRRPFPLVHSDLAAQRGEVRRLPFGRENARREIAVSAFLRAKRIGNVDSGHVSFMITRGHDCSRGLPAGAPAASSKKWNYRISLKLVPEVNFL